MMSGVREFPFCDEKGSSIASERDVDFLLDHEMDSHHSGVTQGMMFEARSRLIKSLA